MSGHWDEINWPLVVSLVVLGIWWLVGWLAGRFLGRERNRMKYTWIDPTASHIPHSNVGRHDIERPPTFIEAEFVEFTSSHVVFRDYDRHLILALRNERVDNLHPEEL